MIQALRCCGGGRQLPSNAGGEQPATPLTTQERPALSQADELGKTQLCGKCLVLFTFSPRAVKDLWGGDYEYHAHHETDVLLQASAIQGCVLCKVLHGYGYRNRCDKLGITVYWHSPNPESAERKLQPFKLHWYGGHLRGGLYIDLMNSTDTIASHAPRYRAKVSLTDVTNHISAVSLSCRASHACEKNNSAFKPLRTLQVLNVSGRGLCYRLVQGTSMPEDSRYVALSHCWGPLGQSLRLTPDSD